jgi:hypothetical protein
MKPNYYTKGDWNAICDACGMQFKASELRKRWDGLMVHSTCWEPRQPQDFVRGVADIQVPPWTRPESTDIFSRTIVTPGSGNGSEGNTFTTTVGALLPIPFAYSAYSTGPGLVTIFFEYAPTIATTFIVTSSGGQTATGTSSPITIVGLPEGQSYGFTVQAINSLGTTIQSNTVYSCPNYTIPNSVDFGVTQYAGPNTTPYSVPTSTTTFERVSTNPCGHSLRKTIDTSYSSRSSGINVTVSREYYGGYGTPVPALSSVTVVGPYDSYYAGVTAAYAAFAIECPTTINTPQAPGSPFLEATWTKIGLTGITTYSGGYYTTARYSTTSGTGNASQVFYYAYFTAVVPQYYLDVHRVWTYDQV